MADLTTTDGSFYAFQPDAVVAVTDHDAVTGEAVTCVHGLAPAPLKIGESVTAFLARIGEAAKFAQLTRANGSPIWLNAPAVGAIRAPLPGEYAAGGQAVISVGSLTQGVTEDPATAKARINAHGGKL